MGMQDQNTWRRQAEIVPIQCNMVRAVQIKASLASVQVRSDAAEFRVELCTHQNYPTTPEFRSLVEQGIRAWHVVSYTWHVLQSSLPRRDDSSALD